MNQHGITFDGAYLYFKEYKYEKIADAVRYAKSQATGCGFFSWLEFVCSPMRMLSFDFSG